jgi:hypothetical protein
LNITLSQSNKAPTYKSDLAYSDNTYKILLFYRFENTNDPIPSSSVNPSSSYWIDGNYNTGTVVSSNNYYIPNSSGFPWVGLSTTPTTTSSGNPPVFNTIFKLIVPMAIPTAIAPSNYLIYCRVGIHMSSNFSFKSVNANLSAS